MGVLFRIALTMSLSGRTHAHPARRERNIAKRACGAPPPSPHGPLQPRVRTHLSLYLFKRYAAAGTKARTSLRDTLQKPRVVLQAVLQPVILRLKADQNARWLAVARDQNLPSRSLLEIT